MECAREALNDTTFSGNWVFLEPVDDRWESERLSQTTEPDENRAPLALPNHRH